MDHRDDGTSATRISLVNCFISALVVLDNIIIQRIVLFEDKEKKSKLQDFEVYESKKNARNFVSL